MGGCSSSSTYEGVLPPTLQAAPDGPHAQLFQDVEQEVSNQPLKVARGKIPKWLNGTLIRNGPANWSAGEDKVNGWFDGYAMLHAFKFNAGSVEYSNKFLRSNAYNLKEKSGHYTSVGMYQDPCKKAFKKFASSFWNGPPPSDNASVNIARVMDSHIALTETPYPVEFDPITLDAKPNFAFDGDKHPKVQLNTAHPHVDLHGAYWGYSVSMGPKSYYNIYKIPPGKKERVIVARIKASPIQYMHSFGMTDNYIVLVRPPLVMNTLGLAINGPPFGKDFASHLKWKPSLGTVFTIIDKETGRVVIQRNGEPCFVFHTINCHETIIDGIKVVNVDVSAYDDPRILQDCGNVQMLRKEFRNNSEVRRFSIFVSKCHKHVAYKLLYHKSFELPSINYQLINGRSYHYAYGLSNSEDNSTTFFNRVVKINVHDRSDQKFWQGAGEYPGEPVFVPIPAAAKFLGDSLWDVYDEMARGSKGSGCLPFPFNSDEKGRSMRFWSGSSNTESPKTDKPVEIESSEKTLRRSFSLTKLRSWGKQDKDSDKSKRRRTVKFNAMTTKTSAEEEDDGVILTVTLNPDIRTAFLVIIDAKTMLELGRLEAPHPIPTGLHGAYMNKQELETPGHFVQ